MSIGCTCIYIVYYKCGKPIILFLFLGTVIVYVCIYMLIPIIGNKEPQHTIVSVTFGVAGRIPFGFPRKTSRRKTAKIQIDHAHCKQ